MITVNNKWKYLQLYAEIFPDTLENGYFKDCKNKEYSLFVICYSLSTESVGLKKCSILFLILQTSKKKEKKKKEESSLLIAEENENSPEMEVVANGPSDPAAAESAEHQKEKSDKVRARFSALSWHHLQVKVGWVW